jgi:hypothetical protein
VEDTGQTWLAELDADSAEARMLRPLPAAATTHHMTFGPAPGRRCCTTRGLRAEQDPRPAACARRALAARWPLAATAYATRRGCPLAAGTPVRYTV